MSRPTLATVDRQALVHNLQRVRQLAPDSQVWAVVKANAYGHGLLGAASALAAGPAAADGFAILTLDDALRLRGAGWRRPILLLEGVFAQADYEVCAAHDLTPVIHDERQLRWLRECRLARPLAVYLKFNTGMNRLGLPLAAAGDFIARVRQLPQVREVTLMTHFAMADVEGGARVQLHHFAALREQHADLPSCAANSAAIVSVPQAHGDWVRPGIMLYGASPFAGRSAASLGLQPVMTLSSELLAVQDVEAGAAIGYGCRFVAPRRMRIGVVACGYADGYPRHAPDGTPVQVDGVRTRLVGRVSMDMLTVDLDPVPQARAGSAVELWGRQVPVDEVAEASGTIAYELLAALAPRVPLCYA